jgi:hypothetical protein
MQRCLHSKETESGAFGDGVCGGGVLASGLHTNSILCSRCHQFELDMAGWAKLRRLQIIAREFLMQNSVKPQNL